MSYISDYEHGGDPFEYEQCCADDFFRTFEELNQEPYINFPTADVVDRNECSKCVLYPFKQLRERLEANMVEVVHGEWLKDSEGEVYCSKCGKYTYDRHDKVMKINDSVVFALSYPNFCGNCGADMRGGHNECE